MPSLKTSLYAIVAAAALGLLVVVAATQSFAADLGGNCCADLEERVAELEATTARKGNRKISLRVYGQVNKALMHISGDNIDSDQAVIENSNAESFVGVAGEAKIAAGWTAGYVLELGVGAQRGLLTPDDSNGVYTRRSFVYLEGGIGRVSLGLTNQATDGITEATVANTAVAARVLSLRPLTGPQIGEAADIFDGSRANVVRYDSPLFAGARLSASWTNGDQASGLDSGKDVWDVALRWSGKGNGFEAAAGVGYRKGVEIPTVGSFASVLGADLTVLSGSASVKHTDTGLFLTAAAGKFDYDVDDVKAYHLQGGIEKKWTDIGATTLYAEYADSNDLDLSIVGAGVVQSINAAAMDVYLTGRRLDIGGNTADIVMIGALVQF